MGRRAKHSKAEFRDIALAAAAEIVAKRGPGELTVRAVAARMGCSVGSLYNNFESAEDLIAHINGRTLDALYDATAAVPLTGVPEDDLHRILDAYLRFVAENRSSWKVLFDERRPESFEAPDWYLAKIERVFGLLEAALQPIFPPGGDAGRPRAAARLLWSALHGVWSLEAADTLEAVSVPPMEQSAREMLDIFLAGLRARAAAGRP